MARIDTGPLPIQHVGDNRHSPLKIVDAALLPYLPRSEQNRKVEQQAMPKARKVSVARALRRVRRRPRG